MSDSQPPSSVEETYLNLDLDDALLQILLLGIYTVVYFGTLYIYFTKKSASQNRIVILAVSLSYLVYLSHGSVTWYLLKQNFVNDGESRDTIFASIYLSNTGWKTLFNDICAFLLANLADGLLIWRCFNVWNRSLRAILLPLFLLLTTISLNLSIIIIASASKLNPSINQAVALDDLTSASFFITSATTVITTLLISYRIYAVFKQNSLRSSRMLFKNIIEILIQSAAAYTLASIASAVTTLVPQVTADTYTTTVFNFTAGVAPTIIVARVALAPDTSTDVSAITHISGLEFHHHSTVPNATDFIGDSIQGGTETVHSSPLRDSEKLDAKF